MVRNLTPNTSITTNKNIKKRKMISKIGNGNGRELKDQL